MLIVTPGDPAGIGPEIVWKTMKARFQPGGPIPWLTVGAREPFEKLGASIIEFQPHIGARSIRIPSSNKACIWLWSAPQSAPNGLLTEGYQAGWSIEQAVGFILRHSSRKAGGGMGLVTGPIHKERLKRGGFNYPGHTEFLAHLCRGSARRPLDVTMMLANSQLRVSLVTTHLALKDVPRQLTRERLTRAILQTAEGLQKFWKIKRPRIAISALNPHAGEQGLFGKEEITLISPTIRSLASKFGRQFELSGPLPADTLFAKHLNAMRKTTSGRKPAEHYDAVICMYHDQGLIPVKLLDFAHTVNITLGLPLIRTSVDHGVGFDIAGKGWADPSSFQAAFDLAEQLISKE